MAEDFVFGPAELTSEAAEARRLRMRGLSHGHRIEPRDPRPREDVTVRITVGPEVSAHDAWCYYTTDGSTPDGVLGRAANGTAVGFRSTGASWDDFVWGFVEELECVIPGQPEWTHVRYAIECAGRWAPAGEGSATETRDFAYVVDSWSPPDWIKDAVMYYVMPDRFNPGAGRSWMQVDDLAQPMGGTLQGIREKLGYIEDMGFNVLWLMPWATAPSYHKYDAIDFYTVDPALGTNDDLRALIAAAHDRGMRVIVDFVANHTSDRHPFFQNALRDASSPHRDWYVFGDFPFGYQSFFDGGDLPHLRLENPDVRRYVIELARHWIREYGIDGYDLDYAVGPSHNFWAEFSGALRRTSTEVVIFTEGVTTPEALQTYIGRVDGCQDFAWFQAARRTFATGTYGVEYFERFLSRSERYFPAEFIAPTFVDNQNMDRFLLLADGDLGRLRVAAACQYTLSQPVGVWAGTEMGMSQAQSATENLNAVRHATAWDSQDEETVDWFRRLGRARQEHAPLRRGARVPLIADDATGVLAYRKELAGESCVVVLNASDEERMVSLELDGDSNYDALSGRSVEVAGRRADVSVGSWSAAILVAGEADAT